MCYHPVMRDLSFDPFTARADDSEKRRLLVQTFFREWTERGRGYMLPFRSLGEAWHFWLLVQGAPEYWRWFMRTSWFREQFILHRLPTSTYVQGIRLLQSILPLPAGFHDLLSERETASLEETVVAPFLAQRCVTYGFKGYQQAGQDADSFPRVAAAFRDCLHVQDTPWRVRAFCSTRWLQKMLRCRGHTFTITDATLLIHGIQLKEPTPQEAQTGRRAPDATA